MKTSSATLRPPRGGRAALVGAILLGAFLLGGRSADGSLLASRVHFVIDGKPHGVFEAGSPWQQEDQWLRGTGRDALLLADHNLGLEDFEVSAVLSVEPGESAFGARKPAAFQIGGGTLEFFGADGQIVATGLPKNAKAAPLGETNRFLQPGRPFELRFARRGPELKIFIDGKQLATLKVLKRPFGEFGVKPNDAEVRLVRFWASGSVLDVDRRVRIDPKEFAELERSERIDAAIEAGVDYLLSNLAAEPGPYGIGRHPESEIGAIAFEAYALIVAGVPADHPLLLKSFKTLDRELIKRGRIYDLSCALFAYDAAIAQEEQDALLTKRKVDPRALRSVGKKHRKSMKKALESLLLGQNDSGAWRYSTDSKDWDHSCTQFAALGLAVAARRQLKIPSRVWNDLARHLLAQQQVKGRETDRRARAEKGEAPELGWSEAARGKKERGRKGKKDRGGHGGTSVAPKKEPHPFLGEEDVPLFERGWEYAKKAEASATWNMTCSGVSSLMVVALHGGAQLDRDLRGPVQRSIRDGIGWMMGNWNAHASHYGLYSLEKVADLGGISHFDNRDWYEEATDFLLANQLADGSWESTGHGSIPRISTGFALLILRRATTLLTRNSAEEIIVTGAESQDDTSPESRAWVYLPRLDRAVSLPGLQRTLRLRPAPPLLKLLEEMCEAYSELDAPEIIPSLLATRERLYGKGPKATLDRCLEAVTGRKLAEPERYREWHGEWERVKSLVLEESQESTTALIEEYAKFREDPRVLRTILPVLMRRSARESAETILVDLDHEESQVRALVYRALGDFFRGSPPDFDPEANRRVRDPQREAVVDWVRQRIGN